MWQTLPLLVCLGIVFAVTRCSQDLSDGLLFGTEVEVVKFVLQNAAGAEQSTKWEGATPKAVYVQPDSKMYVVVAFWERLGEKIHLKVGTYAKDEDGFLSLKEVHSLSVLSFVRSSTSVQFSLMPVALPSGYVHVFAMWIDEEGVHRRKIFCIQVSSTGQLTELEHSTLDMPTIGFSCLPKDGYLWQSSTKIRSYFVFVGSSCDGLTPSHDNIARFLGFESPSSWYGDISDRKIDSLFVYDDGQYDVKFFTSRYKEDYFRFSMFDVDLVLIDLPRPPKVETDNDPVVMGYSDYDQSRFYLLWMNDEASSENALTLFFYDVNDGSVNTTGQIVSQFHFVSNRDGIVNGLKILDFDGSNTWTELFTPPGMGCFGSDTYVGKTGVKIYLQMIDAGTVGDENNYKKEAMTEISDGEHAFQGLYSCRWRSPRLGYDEKTVTSSNTVKKLYGVPVILPGTKPNKDSFEMTIASVQWSDVTKCKNGSYRFLEKKYLHQNDEKRWWMWTDDSDHPDIEGALYQNQIFCRSCPPGTYDGGSAPNIGLSGCLLCPKNTFQNGAGKTGVDDCLQCPEGYDCPSGSSTPLQIQDNTMKSDEFDIDEKQKGIWELSGSEFFQSLDAWKYLTGLMVLSFALCIFGCLCCGGCTPFVGKIVSVAAVDFFFKDHIHDNDKLQTGLSKSSKSFLGGIFSFIAISLSVTLIVWSIMDFFFDNKILYQSIQLSPDSVGSIRGTLKAEVVFHGFFSQCDRGPNSVDEIKGIDGTPTQGSTSGSSSCTLWWKCENCAFEKSPKVMINFDSRGTRVRAISGKFSVPHYDKEKKEFSSEFARSAKQDDGSLKYVDASISVFRSKHKSSPLWNYFTLLLGYKYYEEKNGLMTTITAVSDGSVDATETQVTVWVTFDFVLSDMIQIYVEEFDQGVLNLLGQMFGLIGFCVSFMGVFYCITSSMDCQKIISLSKPTVEDELEDYSDEPISEDDKENDEEPDAQELADQEKKDDETDEDEKSID